MARSHHNTGEGRPPLAVWPCNQDRHHQDEEGRGVWRELARRLAAEYAPPGGTIAHLMCGGAQMMAEAARAGYRVWGLDLAWARQAGPALAEQEPGRGRILAGDARRAGELLGEVAGAVDLVVLTPPAPADPGSAGAGSVPGQHLGRLWGPAYEQALGQVLGAAAGLVRPGGYAALVVDQHRTRSRSGQVAAAAVRGAQQAGLVYIQHVIALTVPICGAALADPVPGPAGSGMGVQAAKAATALHHPAHLDVVVCTRPRPGCGPVEAGR